MWCVYRNVHSLTAQLDKFPISTQHQDQEAEYSRPPQASYMPLLIIVLRHR